jgi:GMP reductase
MRIEEGIKLDFDDVLIRPKRSVAPSRKHVELLRTFKLPHSGRDFTCLPICASNMDTTGTIAMARALLPYRACCALHKFYDIENLQKYFRLIRAYQNSWRELVSAYSFYTLGLKDEDLDKLKKLKPLHWKPFSNLCLDAANGYTKYFVQKVQKLRELYPDCMLVAGNVATPEMTQELILAGADIVKVGIGPGSHCETRRVTGVGYPQLSAIIECADAAHGTSGLIMADGGCRTTGDIAKAFGAGADFVMLGGMFAGTDECEGEWTDDGLKTYGMSSREAQEKYYGGIPEYATSEGRCSIVPRKGPVKDILMEITGGLRSACTYIGASSLKDFSKCCSFVRVR